MSGFEVVTMVCRTDEQAAAVRNLLCVKVTTLVRTVGGTWLHDNGPAFVIGGKTILNRVWGGLKPVWGGAVNCDLGHIRNLI